MYTRREALASLSACSLLGSAGCLNEVEESLAADDDEDENPYEPATTLEPLPDTTPLPPGLVRTDRPPYLSVEDHLAVSNAHMEYLADYPACRYVERNHGTIYDSGAEVVDWRVDGDSIYTQTARQETMVTADAYLMEQTSEFTEWRDETRNPHQTFAQFGEYSEYRAIDAHVRRIDADYDPLELEAGMLEDKTTRYTSYADAERALHDELTERRDPQFGLLGNLYEIERLEDGTGTKLKTYRDRRGRHDDRVIDDYHDFHYWLFDDAGYVRERRKMSVHLQPEDRLSVQVSSQEWDPVETVPDPFEPEWVTAAREWTYPNDWDDGR